jgi:hypothetical protein
MQLTRLDRWLREKFVYEIHISTLSTAAALPPGIKPVTNEKNAGKRYKHLYIARSSKAAQRFFTQLKENNQMYTTEVVDKQAWYVTFIAPKDNKSVTWWVITTILLTCLGIFTITQLKSLTDNPDFRKNFADAVKMFAGK